MNGAGDEDGRHLREGVPGQAERGAHDRQTQRRGLIAFALDSGYSVPPEWAFEDEGYGGASLVRPGLEKIRYFAAEGQIGTRLVLLSHKAAPCERGEFGIEPIRSSNWGSGNGPSSKRGE
jgi:hypothetical protein